MTKLMHLKNQYIDKKNAFFFSIIIIVTTLSSFPWSLHGMNWGDGSMIFHFANRLLHGHLPYKDFVYQIGILPISLDALFQSILGEKFLSSLICSFAIKLGKIFIFYLLFSRFTSKSTALCAGLALIFISPGYGLPIISPILSNIGGNDMTDFMLLLSFLFVIISEDNSANSSYGFIVGIILGLILFGVRQSNGLILIFILFLTIFFCIFRDTEGREKIKGFILPLISGIFTSSILIILILMILDIFSNSFQQMFLDASQKKSINAFDTMLDALSGGIYGTKFLNILLFFILPCIISSAIFLTIFWFRPKVSRLQNKFAAAAISLIPCFIIFAIFDQEFSLRMFFRGWPIIWSIISKINPVMLIYDLPRIFLTMCLLLLVFFPAKSRAYLGINYVFFPFLIALGLGTTWSMQMSWPGRAYVSVTMLIPLIFLTMMMSVHVSSRTKRNLSFCLLIAVFSVFSHQVNAETLIVGGNPDGFYKNTNSVVEHPMIKSIKLSKAKATITSKLIEEIKPGDSCFIYGSAPSLYTLLDCNNPTLLDSTYVDFYTSGDAEKAIHALRKNPPKWIIETIGSRPLEDEFDGSKHFYGSFNQSGPKAMHNYLREAIKQYELKFVGKDLLLAEDFPGISVNMPQDDDFDKVMNLRLYRSLGKLKAVSKN